MCSESQLEDKQVREYGTHSERLRKLIELQAPQAFVADECLVLLRAIYGAAAIQMHHNHKRRLIPIEDFILPSDTQDQVDA